jgi:hypothetical protein
VFKWRPGTDWEEAGITPSKLGEICRKLRDASFQHFPVRHLSLEGGRERWERRKDKEGKEAGQ